MVLDSPGPPAGRLNVLLTYGTLKEVPEDPGEGWAELAERFSLSLGSELYCGGNWFLTRSTLCENSRALGVETNSCDIRDLSQSLAKLCTGNPAINEKIA